MSRYRTLRTLMGAILLSTGWTILGCSSYNYMRDVSPELAQDRLEFAQHHPSSPYSDDVLDGRVRVGMSPTEVRMSWGKPDDVAKASNEEVDEIWTYREDEVSRGSSVYRLRFSEGQLEDIEVRRGHVPHSAKQIVPSPEGFETSPANRKNEVYPKSGS